MKHIWWAAEAVTIVMVRAALRKTCEVTEECVVVWTQFDSRCPLCACEEQIAGDLPISQVYHEKFYSGTPF